MTNAEFYKDKIAGLEFGAMGEICNQFIDPYILKANGRECRNTDCAYCGAICALWLNQEHEEPAVDWENVPVDTPILVTNGKTEWIKRHFAYFKNGKVYAYTDGCTSFTDNTAGITKDWEYAKLWEGSEEQKAYIEAEGKRIAKILTTAEESDSMD